MNIHKNAGLTSRGGRIWILRPERGKHPQDVATAMGISVRRASAVSIPMARISCGWINREAGPDIARAVTAFA